MAVETTYRQLMETLLLQTGRASSSRGFRFTESLPSIRRVRTVCRESIYCCSRDGPIVTSGSHGCLSMVSNGESPFRVGLY